MSPRVRFQLAFTLGEAEAPELAAALVRVARRDAGDPWTQTALLSSAHKMAPSLLAAVPREFTGKLAPAQTQFLSRLAMLVATRGKDAEIDRVLELFASGGSAAPAPRPTRAPERPGSPGGCRR